MEFTGQRYVPSLTGEIYYEHVHRYAIAAPACVGKRVLDLASGEGWGAALLARNAADVIGVDIDAEAVEHARRSYYVPNLRFVLGSATDIPLSDASFDVITSFETIEHLADHERMLDEFRRVLVPNGTLFISSPNKLVYSDLANYENPFHVRELYYQEFRDLLKRRFENVDIYGQRFVSSSVLHPLSGAPSDSAGWYAGDLRAIDDGMPAFNAPVYFVAVCSDGPLFDRVASGFVDPHDDLYTHVRRELDALRYRASGGNALPSPEQATLAAGAQQTALPSVSQQAEHELQRRVAALEAELAAEHARMADALAARRLHEDVLKEAQAAADERAAAHDAALAAERELRAQLESEIVPLRERALEVDQVAIRHAAQTLARRSAEEDVVRLRTDLISAIDSRETVAIELAAEIERGNLLERQVAELTTALDTLREREGVLSDTLSDREAALAARDLRFVELKRALDTRDAEIERRDAMITQRDIALAENDAALRRLDAAQRERDSRIAELEHESGLQIARISALKAMAAERDAMEARIVELQERLARTEAAAFEFRARAEHDGALLRDILGSRSWRMTAVLRRAAATVRGRRLSQ